MADRRMFSKKVIDSARFLKMPPSTQALYFHLGLRADDDGVVEAYTVMKLVGATEDDLKLLVAKGFAVVLNDDLVTYITDWNEHNKIRADRKVDSVYKDLLLQMLPAAPVIESKERADRRRDSVGTSQGQPGDGIGKDRLGKVRTGEESNICGRPQANRFEPPTVDDIESYCRERGNGVDAEKFHDFYASKGWMVGKNKMKDWKACVRTWEKGQKDAPNAGKPKAANAFHNFEQRKIDYESLL